MVEGPDKFAGVGFPDVRGVRATQATRSGEDEGLEGAPNDLQRLAGGLRRDARRRGDAVAQEARASTII